MIHCRFKKDERCPLCSTNEEESDDVSEVDGPPHLFLSCNNTLIRELQLEMRKEAGSIIPKMCRYIREGIREDMKLSEEKQDELDAAVSIKLVEDLCLEGRLMPPTHVAI